MSLLTWLTMQYRQFYAAYACSLHKITTYPLIYSILFYAEPNYLVFFG